MAALEPEQIRLHGEAVAGHWRGGVAEVLLTYLGTTHTRPAAMAPAASTHRAEYRGKTELPVRRSVSIHPAVGTVDLCRHKISDRSLWHMRVYFCG